MAWPAALDRWAFDGNVLEAPDLTPAHIQPEQVALPDAESKEVIAFASTDAIAHAPLVV